MRDGADAEALVPPTYIDASRRRRTVDAPARAAVLAAVGAPGGQDPVWVVRRGAPLPQPGELTLEDGTDLGRVAAVPADAPHGYHAVRADDGRRRLVITGPGVCHLPVDLREWGWAVQLPAARSARSWGIGDLGDLRELAEWSASVGAGFVAVSPISAPNPGPDPDPSPYFPSTRRWANPIHLRVDEVPGAEAADAGLALNRDPLIDRGRVLELKLAALEAAWSARAFDPHAFAAWRADAGEGLARWAAYNVLAADLGADWRRWPEPLRRPAGTGVREAVAAHGYAADFHAWVQWCLDLQLRAASTPLRRISDMPIGADPGGFDAWEWQDVVATGVTIGVPPDRFNLAGQDWGMPVFVPHRLAQAEYRPFIETVRAQLRHAGGLRIDHVLGLFRQWWIPDGASPTQGAYVTQRTRDLLEIVALESERASAVIIGEDLGTVPAGVRPELRRRRMLSTRLVYFERVPPARYPRHALAAVTTHDLPTLAGLWTGADLADQSAAGLRPDPEEAARLRRRVAAAAGLAEDSGAAHVSVAVHRELAGSPAALVAASLEDALGVRKRPNIPGTVRSERANWSVALPVPIESLGEHRPVRDVVAALDAGRRD